MYNCAVIGFGALGKMHFKNLLEIEKERKDICVKAICGVDEKSFQGTTLNLGNVDVKNIDFSRFRMYQDVNEMFAREQLDFVISAMPTYLHETVAVKALEHGAHVFSEKPMELTQAKCENMLSTAKKHGKRLMIGQCLRFHGIYAKTKEYISEKTYGNVRRAEFKRYSCLPKWSFGNWLLDYQKSGGCALDMHIHDVDLVNWFFGMPESVRSVATHAKVEFESIHTRYFYQDKLVTTQADWSFPQQYPFTDEFTILFDNAVLEMKGSQLKVYLENDVLVPEVSQEDHFMEEIREFINCITYNKESSIISADSVMQSIKIVLLEIESAQTGKAVNVR